MTLTYDRMNQLIDEDPLRLRDEAWAEIQRLRAEPKALLLRLADEVGDNDTISEFHSNWLREKAEEL